MTCSLSSPTKIKIVLLILYNWDAFTFLNIPKPAKMILIIYMWKIEENWERIKELLKEVIELY
jgi:hypothetical protein